jgi:beta-galactosidase
MLDLGGPGVYAITTAIDGGRAQVGVRTRVRNDGARAARVSVRARLLDRAGRVAAEAAQRVSVEPAGGAEIKHVLTVPGPHLWQGTEDPYLYRLVVDVRSGDGKELDRLEQDYGIRTMRADGEAGFFLNGRPLRLHGVGMHQDREGKGWDLDARDTEQDVEIIREMGANTIRLTHYQHGRPSTSWPTTTASCSGTSCHWWPPGRWRPARWSPRPGSSPTRASSSRS